VLVLRNVSAAYGPYRALFDVSFRVPDGGIVALVGSNGAGKSTVARTVTGLVTASVGRSCSAGQDVTTMPAYKIARLGMAHVVEGRGVFSSLTVEENLTLAFRQRAGRKALAANLERAYTPSRFWGNAAASGRDALGGAAAPALAGQGAGGAAPRSWSPTSSPWAWRRSSSMPCTRGWPEINRNGTALVVVEQQVNAVLDWRARRSCWTGVGGLRGRSRRRRKAVETLMARREEATATPSARAVTNWRRTIGHRECRRRHHARARHRRRRADHVRQAGRGAVELAPGRPARLRPHHADERTGVDPERIDDVIGGCVSQVGEQSTNVTRNGWVSAGLPQTVPATTVDRQCGSSQQAVHFAAAGVAAGHYDLVWPAGWRS
jgi:branched-chain amino acid transport system ATP-binding protein